MTTALYDLIAADYTLFDGIENVTLTPQNGSAVSNVKAIRVMANLRAAAGGVGQAGIAFTEEFGVDGSAALFVLYTATLSGSQPAGGDKITDAAGDVWTIGVSTEVSSYARWKCFCTKDRE